MSHAQAWVREAMGRGQEQVEAGARRLALTLGRAVELALLVGHAQWALDREHDRRPRAAALRFARSGIDRLADLELEDTRSLAL